MPKKCFSSLQVPQYQVVFFLQYLHLVSVKLFAPFFLRGILTIRCLAVVKIHMGLSTPSEAKKRILDHLPRNLLFKLLRMQALERLRIEALTREVCVGQNKPPQLPKDPVTPRMSTPNVGEV